MLGLSRSAIVQELYQTITSGRKQLELEEVVVKAFRHVDLWKLLTWYSKHIQSQKSSFGSLSRL